MAAAQTSRHCVSTDFSAYKLEEVAYVKSVRVDGHMLYAIHASDGTPLTTVTQRDIAFAVVRQNDMEPTSVH